MTVRLCQRATVSCGACCGIYNRADPGRAGVRAELARHTLALARTERTAAAFKAAADRIAAGAPPALIPTIRVCPLAGFLDPGERRVGCLAHPKVTGGIDLRACGVYDVETCEAFLCPSHAVVTEDEAAIVEGVADFHLYGLVVTDAPFLRAVLTAVAEGGGRPLQPRQLRHAPLAAALRRLFAIKEELAAGSDGHFGAFRRGGASEDVAVDAGDAGDGGEPPLDGAARIVARLGADGRAGNDEELLEDEVRARLAAAVAALRAAGAAAG